MKKICTVFILFIIICFSGCNMKKNISEFDYVPNIKKILNDKNIEIYKIKESPILLEYKNIFP